MLYSWHGLRYILGTDYADYTDFYIVIFLFYGLRYILGTDYADYTDFYIVIFLFYGLHGLYLFVLKSVLIRVIRAFIIEHL